MSPTLLHAAMAGLEERSYYCSGSQYYSGGRCYSRSNWHYWGRWVLTGIVIFIFLLFLIVLSRNSRKRRRTGQAPVYGTGWMGKWGGGYQNQQQQPQQGYAMPPPQYSQQPPVGAQYTGTTYNSNEGYYGGPNTGTYNNDIPLQQPPTAYYPNQYNAATNNRTTGTADDYAPPEGPPPAKH